MGFNILLEVKNISYRYTKKQKPAVKDIFFNINDNEVFGVLGKQRCGKTTLINIFCGVIKNYSGQMFLNGVNPIKDYRDYINKIGVVYSNPKFYSRFTAKENLQYFCSLKTKRGVEIKDALFRVELERFIDERVYKFDLSMLKRLAFARAIMTNPDILFLDQPMLGLDDEGKEIIYKLMIDERNNEKTIFLTTDDGVFARNICDRVGFMVNGKIKHIINPNELNKKGKLIEVNYYFKQNIIHQILDTSKMGDRELLSNIIKTNNIKTIHSNESTLNDMLAYYIQEDEII